MIDYKYLQSQIFIADPGPRQGNEPRVYIEKKGEKSYLALPLFFAYKIRDRNKKNRTRLLLIGIPILISGLILSCFIFSTLI